MLLSLFLLPVLCFLLICFSGLLALNSINHLQVSEGVKWLPLNFSLNTWLRLVQIARRPLNLAFLAVADTMPLLGSSAW